MQRILIQNFNIFLAYTTLESSPLASRGFALKDGEGNPKIVMHAQSLQFKYATSLLYLNIPFFSLKLAVPPPQKFA